MFSTTATIIITILGLIIGGGGGGFVVAYRRDRRQAPIDEQTVRKAKLEVSAALDELATRAIERARQDMEKQDAQHRIDLDHLEARHTEEINDLRTQLRREFEEQLSSERSRLRTRIRMLEGILRDKGYDVPPDDTRDTRHRTG